MQILMKSMMLSCKETTALVEKKSIGRLTIKEKVKLYIHTFMCAVCANYKKQSELLDRLLRKLLHKQADKIIPLVENKELKDKIKSKL
jgi:hypothetical protein